LRRKATDFLFPSSGRKSDRSGIVSAFPCSIAHLARWFSERYIVIVGFIYLFLSA
jgi:hypothetical protein